MQRETGYGNMILRILYNRGVREKEQIDNFLNPLTMEVPDPFRMKGMREAVDRILTAIDSKERIRIIGDYDQDGVASTALLMIAMERIGARVDYRIPDRMLEGYGLQTRHVEEAVLDDIGLLLTCDNGVQSFEAAARAKETGIDLIVTDHHQVRREEGVELLPDAIAVLNPNRSDCEYPFKTLAGAGVSLKLAEALWKERGQGALPEILIGYAAMGTVCDIVDLVGENRSITVRGIEALNRTSQTGIKKLMEATCIRGKLDAYAIGFVLGPCINAAGRLADASEGVELLLTDDEERASSIANALRELNTQRQTLTQEAFEEAKAILSDEEPEHIVFLELPDAHESILGIVAGKIRDLYYRPTFLVTKSQDDTVLKGSARSISSYSMIEHLMKSESYFTKYGGHAMAAGFSFLAGEKEKLIESLLAEWKPSKADLTKKLRIDFPVDLQYITSALVTELRMLEPYGKGNPKPLFASRNVILAGVKAIGKNQSTLRFRFLTSRGEITGIQFSRAEETLTYLYRKFGMSFEDAFREIGNDLRVDLVYSPQIHEYKGASNLQIVVEDIR